jgi:hypothetical protein
VSADSFLINTTQNKKPKPLRPILPLLIKKSRCMEFNKYKTCLIISGTILMSCYTITNDIGYEILGVIFTSGYFTINLGFSYVENYLVQVDTWRLQEAEYEEKTDPPEWNWKIINYTNHLAIIFNLLACITDIDDHYYYLGNGFQIVSFCLRLHNNYKNTKNLIVCFMDLTSMILFFINKYYNFNSVLLILTGTYVYIISELFSI